MTAYPFDRSKSIARKAKRAARIVDNAALAGNPPEAQEGTQEPAGRLWGARDATYPIPRRKPITRGKIGINRKKKKKSPTLSKLKKLLWAEISLLVRSWSEVCLACGLRPSQVAAHIVPSSEGASTRFFLPNLYPCCIICNGMENWNRANWVYIHRNKFGADFVDALFAMSETTFQLKKHWVIEQTERMKKLRAREGSGI